MQMGSGKHYAVGWKRIGKIEKLFGTPWEGESYRIEFVDASGNTVRVRINIEDLIEFGKRPEKLGEKAAHTERVLRAILETYVSKHGIPTREIDAKDLVNDLASLKHKFRADPLGK